MLIFEIYMMNVTRSKNISFKGKIIDAHTHVGKWGQALYSQNDLDIFIKSSLDGGDVIEKMIVSNLSCIETEGILDEMQGNKQLLEIAKNNPKIAPLAVCQPNITNGDTTLIERLFKENPDSFTGLKFHPKSMQLSASDRAYDSYLDFAHKHNLPCLFHSDRTFDVDYGQGNIVKRCEYSRPDQIYELAKRHKDVPVILGHMGGNTGNNTKAAVDIMVESIENNSAKLYADISWVNADTTEKPDIIEAIKRLKNTSKGDKTDRLLFGTDAPIGRFGGNGENGLKPYEAYQKVVTDVKNAIKNAFSQKEADELIEKIFYKNADNLFFSKSQKKAVLKKMPVYAGIAVLCAVLSFVGVKMHNKKDIPVLKNIQNEQSANKTDTFASSSKIFSSFSINY